MVGLTRAFVAFAFAGLSGAHPLHTTFTEISEAPGGQTFTVTVRAFTDDLAHALGGAVLPAGAQAPLSDSALARYVRSRFSVTDRSGRRLDLRYTGQRQSADLSWVTFSASVPAGLSGSSIIDRLQTELYGDQVNLVQARYAGRSETLLFSPGDGARPLP